MRKELVFKETRTTMGIEPLSVHGLITEENHQETILGLLRLNGWMVSVTPDSQGADPGEPYIRAVNPVQGRVLFIEAKTQTGKLRKATAAPKTGRILPGQQEWAEALDACPGVEYYLIRPADMDELEEIIKTPTPKPLDPKVIDFNDAHDYDPRRDDDG